MTSSSGVGSLALGAAGSSENPLCPRVQRGELVLTEEVLRRASSRWAAGAAGRVRLNDSNSTSMPRSCRSTPYPSPRSAQSASGTTGGDRPAGRERDLVEHREIDGSRVTRIASRRSARRYGTTSRHRDLGAEERERLRVEREVAGERRQPVAPPERGGERLLGDRAHLEQVRPEPPAEDDLVLERALDRVRIARRVLHEELAEAWHPRMIARKSGLPGRVSLPGSRIRRASFAGRPARSTATSTMDRPVLTDSSRSPPTRRSRYAARARSRGSRSARRSGDPASSASSPRAQRRSNARTPFARISSAWHRSHATRGIMTFSSSWPPLGPRRRRSPSRRPDTRPSRASPPSRGSPCPA